MIERIIRLSDNLFSKLAGYFISQKQKKDDHDIKIFKKLSDILNDDQFEDIIRQTETCYFPENLLWNCDGLSQFVDSPSCQFMHKELQKKITTMRNNLDSLGQLYAYSNYGDIVGNGSLKLMARKEHLTNDIANKMIAKNRILRNDFIKSYTEFRLAIKNILLI